jgi:hypothetical protein
MLESGETNQFNTSLDVKRKRGGQIGSSGINSNQHTSIAIAFRKAGLDWRENLAKAILADDQRRIALWVRLLPYLVSKNKKNLKRGKGRASRAALDALSELENR